MSLVPHRFLFRLAHPCRHAALMPQSANGRLLDLSEEYRIDNFAAMDGQRNFADVRLGWNETGLGLQVEVRGKEKPPQGSLARPRGSDGVTLWLDMRDTRTGHRASRYCQQFHFLASGAGENHDEPAFVQAKINRALDDAPHAPAGSVAFLVQTTRGGYLLEAFLPAAALHGYDPEQHSRLGFFYAVRDDELGEQLLNLSPEFPFWEDPSLWSVLELVR
jgi:hypothetical protein